MTIWLEKWITNQIIMCKSSVVQNLYNFFCFIFDARSLCMQGWFSPLWVAFAILIGGLLLDVLISVSLGVSALPVNIIIGME